MNTRLRHQARTYVRKLMYVKLLEIRTLASGTMATRDACRIILDWIFTLTVLGKFIYLRPCGVSVFFWPSLFVQAKVNYPLNLGRNEHQISLVDTVQEARCIIVLNFVKIRDFFIFQDGSRHHLCHHLGFQTFSYFIGWGGVEGRDVSSCQISSKSINLLQILPFFDFSRWRPSTILDLLGAYFDHPRRYLAVFIPVQNLVAIDAVVSKIW